MDGVKNNFEEMKKLLLGALAIMEETNAGLMNRMAELERRIEELESKDMVPTVGVAVEDTVEDEAGSSVDDTVEDMAEETVGVETEDIVEVEEVVGYVVENKDDTVENKEPAEDTFEETVAAVSEDEPEIYWENTMESGNQEVKMINDIAAEEPQRIVNEAAKPDWYDWEVDYPAAYVEDVYAAISFNDRYEFIKELFNVSGSLDQAEMLFKETLDTINEMDNFKKVVAYIREKFPEWDEQSDEVYRFYMAVRRKFNKQ